MLDLSKIMNVKEAILKFPFAYSLFDLIVGKFGLARTSLFAQYLPYTPGMKVLDLGCGTGASAKYFRSQDYIGIDIDNSYIKAAKKKFPSHRFLCKNFLDISESLVPVGGFDLILAMGVFHHLDDQILMTYLLKSRSVLAQHGRLISFDGCTYQDQSQARRSIVLSDRGQYIRDAYVLIDIIEKHGFDCCASIEEHKLLIPHSMLAISSMIAHPNQ